MSTLNKIVIHEGLQDILDTLQHDLFLCGRNFFDLLEGVKLALAPITWHS
jgi:hypothetical protein